MNTVLAWPLWSLRDATGGVMDKLRKGDVNCLLAMLMLNVRCIRAGQPAPDPKADGSDAEEFGEPSIAAIARVISVSRDSIERSLARLRSLRVVFEERESERVVRRTIILPSPPREPPIPRIHAEPLRWIWAAEISDGAKRLMTFLWTYRKSHLAKDAEQFQLVSPGVATLAKSARVCSRSFYAKSKGKSSTSHPGFMNELENLGWVTVVKKYKDRSSDREIRVVEPRPMKKPAREKSLRELTGDLLAQFDELRKRAGHRPILAEVKRSRDRQSQAEELVLMLLENGMTAEQYLHWAELGISPCGDPPVVQWADLIDMGNFRRFLKAKVGSGKTADVIDLDSRR